MPNFHDFLQLDETTRVWLSQIRGTLMIQGTTSDAGKSTVVAGLCRLLHRAGVRVAPFKPQNMALNSAVTVDGGEIGRAQALQAQAAGLAAHTDMNPVLLKPSSDTGAQIIIHGKVRSEMDARAYHEYKSVAMPAVMESYQRLQAQYDVVLVEGAGSPAEINLRERDIANMGFAEAADCPVVLVADIDRGGVFAHLTGTLNCLSQSEQHRIKGFIINRFRGDISLLKPGLDWLEAHTAKPVAGVLPYLQGLHLDAEDAIQSQQAEKAVGNLLRVVIPVLPRIANHTDFDPLRQHPQVDCRFIGPGQSIPPADLIILPGSKAVQADLAWLRQQGWEAVLKKHLRYGGKLIGICGGMQMLGMALHDPHGLEGQPGSMPGLGILDYQTTLAPEKQLRNVMGHLAWTACHPSASVAESSAAATAPIQAANTSATALSFFTLHGYEIHMGVTHGPAMAMPACFLQNAAMAGTGYGGKVEGAMRPDGARSADGQILATYVHGLFDHPQACAALLAWAGLEQVAVLDLAAQREAALDRLATACAEALHLPTLFADLRIDRR